MKISICTDPLDILATDLLALGAFEDQWGDHVLLQQLDRTLKGEVTKIANSEGFKAKQDQRLLIHSLGQIQASRILLLGLGKREDFEIPDTRRYAARAVQQAAKAGARQLTLSLPPVDPTAQERSVQMLTEGLLLGSYRFDKYKTRELSEGRVEAARVVVSTDRSDPLTLAVSRGQIIAEATIAARDLVNEPACFLTPTQLAEYAAALARDCGLECKLLGPKECEKQKMGLFLAVSRGSCEEPRFVHLTYRPRGKERPKRRFVLVGKAVTFDSGGLSLKPSASMLDMKTDMAGAAALLGVARALGPLGVQSEVHLILPATENMISGSAFKLGDVFSGMTGRSVEIVNTDAEGRLTLADALAYGSKLSPDEMIDVATLTGACVVALGPHIAGVMGTDRALVERFMAAARRVGEEVWPLPLPERLSDQLKSPVADLKNSGDRWGGALVGGLFLKEFVGKSPWIHIDIAGPASADKEWGHVPKGATGFGVASLLEYLTGRDDAP